MDCVKSIEKKCPDIIFKKLQELNEDDILNILHQYKNNSQSVIDQTYNLINASLKRAIKDKRLSPDNNPMANIERHSVISTFVRIDQYLYKFYEKSFN